MHVFRVDGLLSSFPGSVGTFFRISWKRVRQKKMAFFKIIDTHCCCFWNEWASGPHQHHHWYSCNTITHNNNKNRKSRVFPFAFPCFFRVEEGKVVYVCLLKRVILFFFLFLFFHQTHIDCVYCHIWHMFMEGLHALMRLCFTRMVSWERREKGQFSKKGEGFCTLSCFFLSSFWWVRSACCCHFQYGETSSRVRWIDVDGNVAVSKSWRSSSTSTTIVCIVWEENRHSFFFLCVHVCALCGAAETLWVLFFFSLLI